MRHVHSKGDQRWQNLLNWAKATVRAYFQLTEHWAKPYKNAAAAYNSRRKL